LEQFASAARLSWNNLRQLRDSLGTICIRCEPLLEQFASAASLSWNNLHLPVEFASTCRTLNEISTNSASPKPSEKTSSTVCNIVPIVSMLGTHPSTHHGTDSIVWLILLGQLSHGCSMMISVHCLRVMLRITLSSNQVGHCFKPGG